MHARVTLFELDTIRQPLDTGVLRFEEEILPEIRDQEGYEGTYVLANPDGKGLVLTLWATPEDAERGEQTGKNRALLDKFVTVFRGPPGRESYGVVVADAPSPELVPR